MAGVSTILLGLAQLAAIALASPISLQKRAPEYCSSGGISRLGSLLDVNSATAFCSEYLAIPTVTIPATETLQTYTTVTSTIDQYEATTQTISTQTLWATISTTVATVPTTVATSVSTSVSISTFTVTPARVTIATTAWYTAGVAKRDEAEVVKRAAETPAFVKGFAPHAISSACSCLDVPSPSVTATETVYNPNTINTQVTKTITNTVHATLTLSSTSTVRLTSYVPITKISTYISTTITTITTATPTFTSTISSAFRPQCTAILSRPKLFTAIQPLRSWSYPFATTGIPNGGLNEPTFGQCCELCYRTPDCGQYYTYQARPGDWRCQIIYSYGAVPQGVSAQCPNGRVVGEGVSGPAAWVAGNQARGIGPCYGYTVPV
ncbi:hypothetical protein AOL_s00007g62 [Orbilia oligospora ATCC 24927]|uniref:Apple domain-containing protein n=1 Tax=Arthrobotrys oligospora (strain ATCC 24927 / CBS 115.81 / DSM 1491) TaxID=756982 RepID=G1X1A3_ARTOA|nr:hypothetical protein AOL_s00007g62 [Orbilia oligospora ATCC 24927]EGX53113.1 hypothetical protein AOL_s00007g62 [Orbilia oligospora ATCC 24927]